MLKKKLFFYTFLIFLLIFFYFKKYFYLLKISAFFYLVQNIFSYIDITDGSIYYAFFFCYFLLNIFFTPIFLKKSLNLYWFLIYMLFSFVLFNFSSFIGFLILVELTTITFINVLVLTFSNYFSKFQFNVFFWLIFVTLCFGFCEKYQYNFYNIYDSYINYYELFGTFYWNDFIGVYNYLFLTQTLSIPFLAIWFLIITLCLIFLLKNMSVLSIVVGLQFGVNIYHWFFEFFNDLDFRQEAFYWECTTPSPIEKFY